MLVVTIVLLSLAFVLTAAAALRKRLKGEKVEPGWLLGLAASFVALVIAIIVAVSQHQDSAETGSYRSKADFARATQSQQLAKLQCSVDSIKAGIIRGDLESGEQDRKKTP